MLKVFGLILIFNCTFVAFAQDASISLKNLNPAAKLQLKGELNVDACIKLGSCKIFTKEKEQEFSYFSRLSSSCDLSSADIVDWDMDGSRVYRFDMLTECYNDFQKASKYNFSGPAGICLNLNKVRETCSNFVKNKGKFEESHSFPDPSLNDVKAEISDHYKRDNSQPEQPILDAIEEGNRGGNPTLLCESKLLATCQASMNTFKPYENKPSQAVPKCGQEIAEVKHICGKNSVTSNAYLEDTTFFASFMNVMKPQALYLDNFLTQEMCDDCILKKESSIDDEEFDKEIRRIAQEKNVHHILRRAIEDMVDSSNSNTVNISDCGNEILAGLEGIYPDKNSRSCDPLRSENKKDKKNRVNSFMSSVVDSLALEFGTQLELTGNESGRELIDTLSSIQKDNNEEELLSCNSKKIPRYLIQKFKNETNLAYIREKAKLRRIIDEIYKSFSDPNVAKKLSSLKVRDKPMKKVLKEILLIVGKVTEDYKRAGDLSADLDELGRSSLHQINTFLSQKTENDSLEGMSPIEKIKKNIDKLNTEYFELSRVKVQCRKIQKQIFNSVCVPNQELHDFHYRKAFEYEKSKKIHANANKEIVQMKPSEFDYKFAQKKCSLDSKYRQQLANQSGNDERINSAFPSVSNITTETETKNFKVLDSVVQDPKLEKNLCELVDSNIYKQIMKGDTSRQLSASQQESLIFELSRISSRREYFSLNNLTPSLDEGPTSNSNSSGGVGLNYSSYTAMKNSQAQTRAPIPDTPLLGSSYIKEIETTKKTPDLPPIVETEIATSIDKVSSELPLVDVAADEKEGLRVNRAENTTHVESSRLLKSSEVARNYKSRANDFDKLDLVNRDLYDSYQEQEPIPVKSSPRDLESIKDYSKIDIKNAVDKVTLPNIVKDEQSNKLIVQEKTIGDLQEDWGIEANTDKHDIFYDFMASNWKPGVAADKSFEASWAAFYNANKKKKETKAEEDKKDKVSEAAREVLPYTTSVARQANVKKEERSVVAQQSYQQAAALAEEAFSRVAANNFSNLNPTSLDKISKIILKDTVDVNSPNPQLNQLIRNKTETDNQKAKAVTKYLGDFKNKALTSSDMESINELLGRNDIKIDLREKLMEAIVERNAIFLTAYAMEQKELKDKQVLEIMKDRALYAELLMSVEVATNK